MKPCKCGSLAINLNQNGRDGAYPEKCDVCFWKEKYESLKNALFFDDAGEEMKVKSIKEEWVSDGYHYPGVMFCLTNLIGESAICDACPIPKASTCSENSIGCMLDKAVKRTVVILE